ncbi:hypothetical protein ABB26_05165 [Stenotrophomonas humi]|uniref:Uncharacterized protein n=1 Tax=Stenotrophomonas humi TaxID=405444 RepID=A0A0R0C662_9GAMM|nr:hypothetical protein ABB26_05165 [Stenotrophomonas humi]
MSGVDVLAVMDDVARFHDNGSEAFDSLREARAAVAELIEAASRVQCTPCLGTGFQTVRVQGDFVVGCDPYPCPKCTPLRTALSRVRGAE